MKDFTTMGCLAIIFIGLLVAVGIGVNFLLMPYLLMIALGAFGVHFSYLVCIVLWIVVTVLLRKLLPSRKAE